ncbi:hypothetical protein DSO57_1006772 [Entomophthora muscae]|uniref:Uncharacterized protein n=1 Tax=Entomophthora muscae TaxID=34485 RepID=A0ACC2S9I4_9FUNG|nr:hypothetical protein DSO57_1006772 [Entomophthora muscae]
MVLGLHVQEILLLQAAVTHHWDQFAAYQQWTHSLFSLLSDNQCNSVTSQSCLVTSIKRMCQSIPKYVRERLCEFHQLEQPWRAQVDSFLEDRGFLFCFHNFHKHMVSHECFKVSWVNMVMHFASLYGEGSAIPVNMGLGLSHPIQAKYNIVLGDWYDGATEYGLHVSNLGVERFCLLSDWCASVVCHDDPLDIAAACR